MIETGERCEACGLVAWLYERDDVPGAGRRADAGAFGAGPE